MILIGDCRETLRGLPDGAARCCVTSPPYWGLRDYGCAGQIGLEKTPEAYVTEIVAVFREVKRVLADDGTLWLNLGDSYAAARGGTTPPAETLGGGVNGWMPDGSRVNRDRKDGYNPSRNAGAIGLKHKDLVGIPWRVAFALQADGWYLRSDIIWHKPNPMPESVTDRPTKAHEYVFLLAKSARYFYDAKGVAEPMAPASAERYAYAFGTGEKARDAATPTGAGIDRRTVPIGFREAQATRNARTVWTIPTQPTPDAHFATFPEALAERCILAGSAHGDTVLDPFFGSGTVGKVAERLGRKWIGCELNPSYVEIGKVKTAQKGLFV